MRTGAAIEHFATPRHTVLHLLKQDTATPGEITAQRLKAGWSAEDSLKALAG